MVLRGLVNDWPVVRAAKDSPRALGNYLAAFDAGEQIEVFFGEPAIAGKYYYDDGFKGFSFERRTMRLRRGAAVHHRCGRIRRAATRYTRGPRPAGTVCRDSRTDNAMPLLAAETPPRIWLGTAANVSSHYDTFDNLACVIAGRGAVSLSTAPELISRLYIGPIDRTMAGPPVSLAASSPQDDQRFPLFRDVRDQAWVCELQAGDALYLPKLWWHQVESTGAFNGLVNYWWDGFASGPDAPYTSLLLAMITDRGTAGCGAAGLEGITSTSTSSVATAIRSPTCRSKSAVCWAP